MPAVTANSAALRARLVAIAAADVGKVEQTRNRAPWIAKFWPATSYPDGHTNREPYCAAAVAFWVQQWLLQAEVRAALNLTPTAAETWRCKSARAFDWEPWARQRGLTVLSDAPGQLIRAGDLMIFDMSHIGIVAADSRTGTIETIEANTGPSGGRDGDGCWRKTRPRSLARCFIRLLA